jgi:hemerythrin superfamily protein
MTTLADQDSAQLGGPLSVLTRQKRDHERLGRLLHELAASATDADQDAVLNRIARLVFPHAFAEESILWPEIRRVLPDGARLTSQVEREHQEVNELWRQLESGPRTRQARRSVLDRLVEVLLEDVREEEDTLLPRLQEQVDRRRLQALGVAWEAVRQVAPTRPHPVVSRRPPGNALAALPLTVLDRSRDVVDQLARRLPQTFAPACRVSNGLAAMSRRVEQLPWFRIGEDISTARGG